MKQANPRFSNVQAAQASVKSYKEAMVDSIVASLYGEAMNDMFLTLRGIAQDNMKLTGCKYEAFYYRGKFYTTEQEDTTMALELDPKLYPRMKEYLEEHQRVKGYEMFCVKSMLTTMVAKTNRLEDYKAILPEQLHPVLNRYNALSDNKGLSPMEVAQFKKRLSPFLDVIKGRMLQNMIQGNTP
jgi:hypothetical protein